MSCTATHDAERVREAGSREARPREGAASGASRAVARGAGVRASVGTVALSTGPRQMRETWLSVVTCTSQRGDAFASLALIYA